MALFRPSEGVIGSPALDAFYVGRFWDEASGFVAR